MYVHRFLFSPFGTVEKEPHEPSIKFHDAHSHTIPPPFLVPPPPGTRASLRKRFLLAHSQSRRRPTARVHRSAALAAVRYAGPFEAGAIDLTCRILLCEEKEPYNKYSIYSSRIIYSTRTLTVPFHTQIMYRAPHNIKQTNEQFTPHNRTRKQAILNRIVQTLLDDPSLRGPAPAPALQASLAWLDQCRALFEELDRDGRGTLTAAELEAGLRRHGTKMASSELVGLFK